MDDRSPFHSDCFSFQKFIDTPAFEEIKKRAIFVHVDVPGHETNASDLRDGAFPTIQHLGEDLVTVLNQLRIKYVIGLGDGAGANVMARFAMMNSTRCMGVILLHPTSNKATMVANFKDKMSKWKVNKVDESGENLAIFRKFGHKVSTLYPDRPFRNLRATKSGDQRTLCTVRNGS